jgi:precorrin-2 dehydrogenase/sirohydrochlorin ferrochelatase
VYPIFLNVKNKLCVVVGGGKVAERKIKKLIQEKAEIIVISKSTTQRIKNLEQKGKIKKIVNSEFTKNMIPEGTFLVFECTGDKDVAMQDKARMRRKKNISKLRNISRNF